MCGGVDGGGLSGERLRRKEGGREGHQIGSKLAGRVSECMMELYSCILIAYTHFSPYIRR